MKKISFFSVILSLLLSPMALAGGGGGGGKSKFDWKNSSIIKVANDFVGTVAAGQYEDAYKMGGKILRESRTLEQFTADMKRWGLDKSGTVQWKNGNGALAAGDGFKLMGAFKLTDGGTIPVYMHFQGDAHVAAADRERKWNDKTVWTVMDYKSAQSMFTRLANDGGFIPRADDPERSGVANVFLSVWDGFRKVGCMTLGLFVSDGESNGLDKFLFTFALLLLIGLVALIGGYVVGLKGHPRELWLMFFTKVTEYSAYGAASSIFVLFLQNDVTYNGAALGDSNGYLYYMIWGLVATIITMMVGSVCDTIGVKKCLLIGAWMLLVSRFCTPLSQDVWTVTFFGFLPLAFGFAITGPVLKVGIKWFTTLKTATLGFGLFYTLMNVGFTIGAEIADYFRKYHADGYSVFGYEFTTYQAIIGIGFLINIPDLIAILLMRDGAEMTEKGIVMRKPDTDGVEVISSELKASVAERRSKMISELKKSVIATGIVALGAFAFYELEVHTWKLGVVKTGSYLWSIVITCGIFAVGGILYAKLSYAGTLAAGGGFDRVMKSVRDATAKTIDELKENFTEKPFWIYMAMLGILTFVKLTFYVFHVMFPTYAIRVFGDDFPVVSLFGTLNPAMIVFLVPLVSLMTVKVRSYTMLIIGTTLSAVSVFICFIPDSVASAVGNTWFGTFVFDYWVEAPAGGQDPFVISLLLFIIVFTIGEAIWSPRLMQFSAEIAPRGKEGAYIALAVLPYFLGKIGATVMADILTEKYFARGMTTYPEHEMSWLWIAIMCLISPIGMILFKGTFTKSERMAEEAAQVTLDAEEKALQGQE